MNETWVSKALKRNNLTHREVARNLNKPMWYISECCKSTKNLSIVEIYELAEALGVGFIYACVSTEKEITNGGS